MTLTELRNVLDERGIRLTRSLGQNFLHDRNLLRKIAAAGDLALEDSVVEIGPGLGALTVELIERAGHVLAVEKDQRLYAYLTERFAGDPKLELWHGDALEMLQTQQLPLGGGCKVVSNLPYSVGSPILVELTLSRPGPAKVVVTLQLEVAERAQAQPGKRAYGILSLLSQLHYQPVHSFKISRRCFFPEPDVDSACLVLERRKAERLDEREAEVFRQIVKVVFGQRRKMMMNSLKAAYPEAALQEAWRELGLKEQARAEEVSLEEFVGLAKLLSGKA